jgi:hypothetical protein
MNIQEFRQQYPQYNDISDAELANTLHKKYYSDMDHSEFSKTFLGVTPMVGGGDTGGKGVTGTTPQPTFNVLSLLVGGRPVYPIEKRLLSGLSDQDITKELPTIGMIAGGAGGTALGGPPGGVLGAGLGAGVGKSAQMGIEHLTSQHELATGQPGAISAPSETIPSVVYDIGKEMLYGAGAEMGGGLIGKGAELAFKPGLDLAKRKLAQGLLEKGMPITRGTIGEKIVEKIPPGNLFFQKWRKKLSEMILQSNKQYATEVLGLPSLALKPGAQESKKAAFDKMVEAAGGKESLVPTPNLKAFIEGNLDTLYFTGNKGMQKALSALREDLARTGEIQFGQLNNISSNVWGKNFNKLAPQEKAVLGSLREAVELDMKHIQETTGKPVWDAYTTAMEKSRQVHRFADTAVVEGMFKRATDYHIDKQEYIFSPVKFRKIVDDMMPRLQVIFKDRPEIPKGINNYADQMMLAARDLQRYAGTKPAMEQAIGWLGVGGLPISIKVLPGLAVPWGFETEMAHSLAHPRGWMKKWLFRESAGNIPKLLEIGIKPPLLKLQQGVNP